MLKIAFYTLGCKSNQYETDNMNKICALAGFDIVPFDGSADIYVINSCTVTGNADKKSRHAIRFAKKKNKDSVVIVTGCYVDAGPDELYKIKEADILLKNNDKKNILNYLPKIKAQKKQTASRAQRVRANLMIENGCQNFCSYCIVPHVRGKVANKPVEQAITEAKQMIKEGVKEIVLTGINLGEYNKYPEQIPNHKYQIPNKSQITNTKFQAPLPQLINKLSGIEGLLRIRLSSIEPMYVNDELIRIVKENPKVCKHLHIPLQSGDDKILESMNRNYTSKDFLYMAKAIQKQIKDIAVTTDIIVGFPGEDEKAFKNTCKLVNKIKFSRIHVFSYSDRPGTAAFNFKNKVDSGTIAQRYEKMGKLRAKYMLKFHRSFKRDPLEVLIEQRDRRTGQLEGLTSNYIRVFLEGLPPEARTPAKGGANSAAAKAGYDTGDDSLGRLIPVRFKGFRVENVLGAPILV